MQAYLTPPTVQMSTSLQSCFFSSKCATLPRLLILTLLLLKSFLPSVAQSVNPGHYTFAGHYNVTYSGGTAMYSNSFSSSSGSYGPFYNNSYGASPSIGGMSCVTSCSGTITSTFTWVPIYNGEQPPQSVIVKEDSSVNASEGMGGTGTLLVADGFGDAPITSSNSSYAWSSSSGTHYTLKQSPGPSFIVTCTPSASSSTSYGFASSSVSYRASVLPITIQAAGVTVNQFGHDPHILIGQGCSSNLNFEQGIGSTPPTANITFDSYNWTVPLQTFASYWIEPDLQRAGRVTYVDPATWHSDSPHWYWRQDGSTVISCSATMRIDGVSYGTVTAAYPLTVSAPGYDDFAATPNNPSTFKAGSTGVYAGPAGGNAIDFKGQVYTPDFFNLDYPNLPYAGQWAFLQLCNIFEEQGLGYSVQKNSTDGQFWLDNQAPYEHTDSPYPAHWYDEMPVTSELEADAPELDFVFGSISCDIEDTFQMYIMYMPPPSSPFSADVQWVPLARVQWYWYLWADRGPFGLGPWQMSPRSALGYVVADSVTRITEHPIWEHKWINPQ